MDGKAIKYKVLKIKKDSWLGVNFDGNNLESELNKLGVQGWDLTTSIDINVGHGSTKEIILILKKFA